MWKSEHSSVLRRISQSNNTSVCWHSTTGPFRSPSPNCWERTFCTCITRLKDYRRRRAFFKLLMVVISVKSDVYLAIKYQMYSIRLKYISGFQYAVKKVINGVMLSKKTSYGEGIYTLSFTILSKNLYYFEEWFDQYTTILWKVLCICESPNGLFSALAHVKVMWWAPSKPT